jgi:hypothetical protein
MKASYLVPTSVLILGLIGCGGGGSGSGTPAPTTSVTISNYTATVARGSYFFVQASLAPDQVEIRLDGVLLEGLNTELVYEEAVGAIYQIPESVTPGTAQLSVRAKNSSNASDTKTITITEPIFLDDAAACGVAQEHKAYGEAHMCMPLSTGVALADYDNDGDTDMFLGNLDNPGRLMRNDGDTDGDVLPNFVHVTDSGLGETKNISSASFVDYDNDGDQDLFIGRWGYNFLFKNMLMETGTATFKSVTDSAGFFKVKNRAMGLAWGDFDQDGDLDLYITKHTHCALDPENIPMLSEDQLYRNDGEAGFTDVTYMLDPTGDLVKGLGFSAVWVDFDLDGDQDLFVVNDFINNQVSRANLAFRNDGPDPENPGNWLFTDISVSSGFAIHPDVTNKGIDAMGVAVGDINFDGYPDFAFSNIGPNYLVTNNQDGTFYDASDDLKMRRTSLPWGVSSVTWATIFLDYDNDGDLDLFYGGGTIDKFDANGKAIELIPDALFRNDGVDKPFVEVTYEAGLTDLSSSKGSALVDLDRDGFLDIVVVNYSGPVRLYRNRMGDLGNPNNWIEIDLQGLGGPGKSNRDALGAVITLTTPDGKVQTQYRTSKPSLSAGGEFTSHFGLGSNDTITSLTIQWPNGVVTAPAVPAINQRITYVEE